MRNVVQHFCNCGVMISEQLHMINPIFANVSTVNYGVHMPIGTLIRQGVEEPHALDRQVDRDQYGVEYELGGRRR